MPVRKRARLAPLGRPAAAVATALLCLALGCAEKPREITPSAYPSAGLYTPGNTLGAGDPTDMPAANMGLGNRCKQLAGVSDGGAAAQATPGTLQVHYTTQSQQGRYAPKNCSAVWVETPDGQYVATLEIACALRRPGLVYWEDHTCIEKPGPDVVTSASLPDHTKPHSAMWNGVDFAGDPVPDGPYKLFIEVTESDKEPGDFVTFDFDKGPSSWSLMPAVAFDGPLQEITLAWNVKQEGGSSGAAGAH